MTPQSELAPDFKSVASAGTATLDFDLGWNYFELMLIATVAAGNKVLTDIVDTIQFLINGVPQRVHSAAELAAINSTIDEDLAPKTSGSIAGGDLISYLPIPLAETWRKDVGRGKQLGWIANGIRSFQCKVLLKTVTSPSLTMQIVSREEAGSRTIGAITKWKRDDHPATGTPQTYADIFDIGGQRNFLQSVHLFPVSTSYVSAAKLTMNKNVYHDRTYLRNAAILQAKNMNPDQSTYPRYDIVLDESDFLDDPLDLSAQRTQKLELTWNSAPSGNIRVIRIESGLPEVKV